MLWVCTGLVVVSTISVTVLIPLVVVLPIIPWSETVAAVIIIILEVLLKLTTVVVIVASRVTTVQEIVVTLFAIAEVVPFVFEEMYFLLFFSP